MKYPITLICSKCSKPFERERKNTYQPRKNQFCSYDCRINFNTLKFETNCETCDKIIYKLPAELKQSKTGKLFCSQSCSVIYQNKHKTSGTRRSKFESWLEQELRFLYPNIDIVCNQTNVIGYELDFYFPKLNLAFEINGIFHFEPIYGQKKLIETQTNDKKKIELCKIKNIDLYQFDTSKFKQFTIKHSIPHLKFFTNIIDNKIDFCKENNIDYISTDPLRGQLPNKKIKEKTNPLYEALSKALEWQKQIKEQNLSQRDFGKQKNISGPAVNRTLLLLRLPKEIQEQILNKSYPETNVGKIKQQLINKK
jgi:hypothetical protein